MYYLIIAMLMFLLFIIWLLIQYPIIGGVLLISVAATIIISVLCSKKNKNDDNNDSDKYVEVNTFYTKIVGVTFGLRQSYISNLSSGNKLTFVREPQNKHDSNAIAVKSGMYKLGHLSADIASSFADDIDSGKTKLTGEVINITGGKHGESYGCNISVTVWRLKELVTPTIKPKLECQNPDINVNNPLYQKKCVFYLGEPTKSICIQQALNLGAKTTVYASSKTDYFITDDLEFLKTGDNASIRKYKEAIGRNPNIKTLSVNEFNKIIEDFLPEEYR